MLELEISVSFANHTTMSCSSNLITTSRASNQQRTFMQISYDVRFEALR